MTIRNFVFLLYFNGMLIPLYHCCVKQFNMKFMVRISVKYIIFIIEYYCLEKKLWLIFVIIYVDTLRLYIIVMLYI